MAIANSNIFNNEFRGKDKITDVLSFPVHETLRLKEDDDMGFPPEISLGDIVISTPVALDQSVEFGVTLEQEILHLMVHGILHLCGFDHEISDEEEKIMEAHEARLVKEIYQRLKYE